MGERESEREKAKQINKFKRVVIQIIFTSSTKCPYLWLHTTNNNNTCKCARMHFKLSVEWTREWMSDKGARQINHRARERERKYTHENGKAHKPTRGSATEICNSLISFASLKLTKNKTKINKIGLRLNFLKPSEKLFLASNSEFYFSFLEFYFPKK